MPGDQGSKVDISFASRFTTNSIAACFAEVCTIPLDTAKVRLQLQKNVVAGVGGAAALPKYRGLLDTAATIAREEGAAALWKGVVPGLHRQRVYGGLRLGLYEPIKSLYVGQDHAGDVPLSKKLAAGFTTGAIAISIANPTDLVKVRLQAEGKLAPGMPHRYAGAMDAYAKIATQEGVAALWTGLGPNVARNTIINAVELASYDHVKKTILKLPGVKDDLITQLFAGLGAGFFAVCVGSPIDVVKSRMMGDSAYKSTLDCFVKTLKNDERRFDLLRQTRTITNDNRDPIFVNKIRLSQHPQEHDYKCSSPMSQHWSLWSPGIVPPPLASLSLCGHWLQQKPSYFIFMRRLELQNMT